MDTVLVTGGAGFIGSNFVRLLLRRTTARVVVLDKLTYAGNLQSLADVSARSRASPSCTATSPTARWWTRVYREHRPTWVVNFAAESHVDRSIDGPRAFVETNIARHLRAARGARAPTSAGSTPRRARAFRFLHVSTDEVYGSLGPSGKFSETTPYAPNSPYAASKAAADHLVRAYHETYGLPVLITNCSNNYGPYQYPEKLIPLMILNALEGKPLPIYGDGGNVRDWLYVEDHCEGILLVLRTRPAGRQVQHRRRQRAHQPRARRPPVRGARRAAAGGAEPRRCAARGVRQLRRAQDASCPTGRATIAATRSTPAASARELGWQPRHDFESGTARDGRLVSRAPRLVRGGAGRQLRARAARRDALARPRLRVAPPPAGWSATRADAHDTSLPAWRLRAPPGTEPLPERLSRRAPPLWGD